MKYIKQIGLIALSVFIPFVILAKLENTYIPYKLNVVNSISGLTLYDIKILFAYNMPLFYVIAFVAQAIVIVPLWNRARTNKAQMFMFSGSILVLSIVLAFGLSFFLCKFSNDFSRFLTSAGNLLFIQLLYWALNVVTLYFITSIQNLSLQKYKSHSLTQ